MLAFDETINYCFFKDHFTGKMRDFQETPRMSLAKLARRISPTP
jgi:hypothetical protein